MKNSLTIVVSLFILSCSPLSYTGMMSWEEYQRIPSGKTYHIEIKVPNRELCYFGAIHTADPKHPQFDKIEKIWNRFKPNMALCEGCIWPLEKSRELAIHKHGEQGLLRFLAARDDVPIRCIDPSLVKQALFLKHGFAPEEVKVYFILRQAVINRMLNRSPRQTGYVNDILRILSRLNAYKTEPHNLEGFECQVRKMLPELKDWKKIHFACFYCQKSGLFLARIHRALNDYRNHSMIKTIKKEWKPRARIFAVVGRSHVYIQEPVLRRLFQNSDSLSH